MSGTNIFTHASDEARYVYLQPFTSPGSAFESGGDVQDIIEQFDISALLPLPPLPFAGEDEQGSVQYATQAQATALDDVLSVLTPHSLNDVDVFVSPSTDVQLGNVKEVSTGDLTRITASSTTEDIVSYRRFNDMMTARNALADDGSVQSSGFAEFATVDEALAYNPSRFISPMRTWNLIKHEIPNPWWQATEEISGILRTVSSRDSLQSDKTIAISVQGINNVLASASKRGAFKTTSSNISRNASDANEYAITPSTISNIVANENEVGFFELPSSFVDDSTKALSASQGYTLNQKLGPDGGTITGTLSSDNFVARTTQRVKQTTSSGGSYYTDVSEARELYPSNQLDRRVGLNGRPVGSIFHTTKTTDPNTYFGGTWYRIGSGRTMVGEGTGNDYNRKRYFSPGSQSGEVKTILSESHLPAHKHASWGEAYSTTNGACVRYEEVRSPYGSTYQCKEYATASYWKFGKTGSRNHAGMGKTDNDNYMYYTSPVGENGYHENMMPYYSVYIWRRVK